MERLAALRSLSMPEQMYVSIFVLFSFCNIIFWVCFNFEKSCLWFSPS